MDLLMYHVTRRIKTESINSIGNGNVLLRIENGLFGLVLL